MNRLRSCHLSMLRHKLCRRATAGYLCRRACSVAYAVWNGYLGEEV